MVNMSAGGWPEVGTAIVCCCDHSMSFNGREDGQSQNVERPLRHATHLSPHLHMLSVFAAASSISCSASRYDTKV